MGKYAPSRSEPGSAKDMARRPCAQKVSTGRTMAKNLWTCHVRFAPGQRIANNKHTSFGSARWMMMPLSKWKCVVEFSSPAFASSVATLSFAEATTTLCNAMRCDKRREREERKQGQERERSRNPSPREENGRVCSTKFIIGQKRKAKTHRHTLTSTRAREPTRRAKTSFVDVSFVAHAFFSLVRPSRFSPVESGKEEKGKKVRIEAADERGGRRVRYVSNPGYMFDFRI